MGVLRGVLIGVLGVVVVEFAEGSLACAEPSNWSVSAAEICATFSDLLIENGGLVLDTLMSVCGTPPTLWGPRAVMGVIRDDGVSLL